MAAYYNEIDPFAAAWLRELIRRDLICVGEVDERSVEVVQPDDLRGFTQCHFFAGIGVWSYALRGAGWDDDRPVWTGSCPCQPFSAAGKGKGFDDKRHLWPEFFRLIRECRPDVCFGEQTSSPAGLVWLDLVQADLEGTGYACGAANFPAAGVGAPHIRQRLYWVADAAGLDRRTGQCDRRSGGERRLLAGHRGELGDPTSRGRGEFGNAPLSRGGRYANGAVVVSASGLAHSDRGIPGQRGDSGGTEGEGIQRGTVADGCGVHGDPLAGFWRDAEWIPCTDGKARPVEPGSFPLAHGAPTRVGRLRGYGNAINAEQAKAFIEAYLDVCGGRVA